MKVGQPVRTVAASLSPDLYERFLAYVAKVGVSRSSVIRQAIEQYLREDRGHDLQPVSPGRSWETDD
jgi:metal-responsive CopG/Arc/MetJ family transcriptional regulator